MRALGTSRALLSLPASEPRYLRARFCAGNAGQFWGSPHSAGGSRENVLISTVFPADIFLASSSHAERLENGNCMRVLTCVGFVKRLRM